MKNLFLFLLLLFAIDSYSQCNLKVNAGDDVNINCGSSVRLGTTGNVYIKFTNVIGLFEIIKLSDNSIVDLGVSSSIDKWFDLPFGNYRFRRYDTDGISETDLIINYRIGTGLRVPLKTTFFSTVV